MSRYVQVLFRNLVKKIPSTTYATHGLYMYPAKFIPQVVRYAIDNYTKPGDWVFDPFAGYGTVAIEASITGRNAILWDLNPMTRILTIASTCREKVSLNDFKLDWNYNDVFIPKWNRIYYWHPQEFLSKLSQLWGYWHNVIRMKKTECKAYLVAIPLLKISRYFSYADEKISKTYRSKYAILKIKRLLSSNWENIMREMYWKLAREVIKKLNDYHRYNLKNVNIVIRTSWREDNKMVIFDALKERLERRVELLITSPPYLQSQEYIRSFKIELAWLGYTGSDLTALAKHEIPYNNPPAYIKVHSKLYEEYRKRVLEFRHPKLLKIYESYFKSLVHFLDNNVNNIKTIALFVGPAKIRTLRIPIDEILKEHLEYRGFEHVETLIDTIVARRLFKSKTNPATGLLDERTPTEHLLVMRNLNW